VKFGENADSEKRSFGVYSTKQACLVSFSKGSTHSALIIFKN